MKRMLSILTGFAMLVGTATAMPVQAEEQVKDFNYYWNLDDYSVYCEFVELYGNPDDWLDRVPEKTLPKMTDLPWYDVARDSVTHDAYCGGLSLSFKEDMMLTEADLRELAGTPSYFGFPDSWSVYHSEAESFSNVLFLYGSSQTEALGGDTGIIGFNFFMLASQEFDVYGKQDIPVIHSVIDMYRLRLTLEHSQFAQDHIVLDEKYGFHEIWFPAYMGECFVIGDPNEDGIVNAEDASDTLIMAANAGAGNETDFSDAQISAADINGDTKVDAADASAILMYSAALGAGDRYAKIKDFV